MTQPFALLITFLLISLFTIVFFLFRKINLLSVEQDALFKSLSSLRKDMEKAGKDAEKEEVRHHLHMRALQIRDAVYKQTKGPHPRAIEETSSEIGYHSSTLRQLFGPNHTTKMENFFKAYDVYIDTYWKTSKGNIKKVFRGKPSEPFNEYHSIQQASLQLLHELDQALGDFE
ncbi:hypothetical protein D7Z54_17790 [Salibacterium salarium]|uniref:Uncharacterized protein n=1 Tax=Salibacterium salarium TaxID=284579 RepID=A0A3R9QJE6_9BACI|nr:hypothetical protein [Salibacterium salarium]RSL32049.1 hypothetical protein D7Z54_17790 [Salibacterium salarium]